MNNIVVLGIDIGGSLTKVGLVYNDGRILDKTIFKTEAEKDFNFFIKKLKAETDELISKQIVAIEIIAIGVGAPNANPYSGQIENPPNLKWGKATPIAKEIQNTFKLPVYIANDANAAALGELQYGIGKGLKNFVTLTLGTGLGSGIISDGKLLIGAHGVAGEIGHVNVDPYGRKCNCGLQGCLETYASVTGIKRTVFELLSDMKDDSVLRNYSFSEMLQLLENLRNHTGISIDNLLLIYAEHFFSVIETSYKDLLSAYNDPTEMELRQGLLLKK